MARFRSPKDPQDELDYGFDWSRWLPPGDYVSESSWTITGSDNLLTYNNAMILESGTITACWLFDGTPGEKYTLTNTIRTNGGRKKDESMTIVVRNN